jgi:hypothetical protein
MENSTQVQLKTHPGASLLIIAALLVYQLGFGGGRIINS